MPRRTRRAAPVRVECAKCGGSDAIEIELTLPDSTQVLFNSCHRCEHRWWHSDGKTLDLTTILDKVRVR